MISFAEAVDRIRSVARPLGTEAIPLREAARRVLARPVVARIDSPRADLSSMDGYAVRDSDLAAFPVSLEVLGESFPGNAWEGSIAAGECLRIFTGAPLPPGTERVVIQEEVRREDNLAIIAKQPASPRHIRARGSDFKRGDELLTDGRLLDPRALVAAAAADVAELDVHRRPRVHVLSTGDELVEPGTAAATAQCIPDSASLGILTLAEQWGAVCAGNSRLGDDLATLQMAAAKAVSSSDVVIAIGGASVGEKDFARAMFEPLGLELLFSKLAIKPGKPAWLARANEALIVGLPGNPTSAMVTARLLLAPLLAGMCGRPIEAALEWRTAPLATPLEQCGSRETFHRARRNGKAVEILSNQDSGAQKALADAEMLVRQPPNSEALAAGARVETIIF
ncbi:MAG TPA: molybdopterin molybdotransferase MoeA [Sphingomicrobium sp.]